MFVALDYTVHSLWKLPFSLKIYIQSFFPKFMKTSLFRDGRWSFVAVADHNIQLLQLGSLGGFQIFPSSKVLQWTALYISFFCTFVRLFPYEQSCQIKVMLTLRVFELYCQIAPLKCITSLYSFQKRVRASASPHPHFHRVSSFFFFFFRKLMLFKFERLEGTPWPNCLEPLSPSTLGAEKG